MTKISLTCYVTGVLIMCGCQSQKTGSISGLVKNVSGDTLVSNASLETVPQTSATTSGADGRFTFSDMIPGEYVVTATKTGYMSTSVKIRVIEGKSTTAEIVLGPVTLSGVAGSQRTTAREETTNVSRTDEDSTQIVAGIEKSSRQQPTSDDSRERVYRNDSRRVGGAQSGLIEDVLKRRNERSNRSPRIDRLRSGVVAGLVAFYPFDGNANDESGKGNDAIVNGATPATDRFGNSNSAYSFDGMNNFIRVRNSRFLNGNATLTLAVWIKSSRSSNQRVLTKGAPNDYQYAIAFGEPQMGAGNVSIHAWTFAGGDHMKAGAFAGDDRWHFVVGIIQNHTSLELYIDTRLAARNSTPGSNSWNLTGIGDLFIGSSPNAAGNFFGGFLDDIRIYDRALSESEISELYHEGGW